MYHPMLLFCMGGTPWPPQDFAIRFRNAILNCRGGHGSAAPTKKDSEMKIALASDHAGFLEKEKLKPLLLELGLEFHDLGTESDASVDYPDFATRVARAVGEGKVEQ